MIKIRSRARSWERWWWVTLLILAFAVRVLPLEAQGMWRDEVDALRFATASWSELLGRFTQQGWNGPLYSVLLRFWIALTGETTFALRYFSVLWGLLTVPLFYVLARRFLSRDNVMWTTLLPVFSPYLIWYAQEVKMYTWVPMLALLALYGLERAIRRPTWIWWGVVLVATSLAFYSHILAALLIPVEVGWFLLHRRRHPRAWVGGLIVLALLTVPYLPLAAWQAPLAFKVRETGFARLTLWQMLQTLGIGWSAGIRGWLRVPLAVGQTAVALLGVIYFVRHSRWWRALQLMSWLALPLLAIWSISLRSPLFTDRYLIWTAPAFYLLVGGGLAGLAQILERIAARVRGVRAETGALVLLTLILLGYTGNLYQQITTPIKPQFREVSAYLETHRRPGEPLVFQIPYNHIVVDFYTDEPLDPWIEAPFTNWRTASGAYQVTPPAVDLQLRQAVQGRECAWLVYAEAQMWDERELVKAWFDAEAVLVTERHYHLVDLYHYCFPEMP